MNDAGAAQGTATARRAAPSARVDDWRILAVLGPYRLVLVATLLSLYRSGFAPDFFERLSAPAFYYGCLSYAVIALLLLLLGVYRVPGIRAQAHLHLAADALVLGTLVLGAGGIGSGLGILLVPPVVGSSLVLSPRLAAVHAAVATLAMFGAQTLHQLRLHSWDPADYSQVGLLGLMFFASGLVANTVAQRARRSEEMAARVGSEFVSLTRLSENIIESMQTGVLVVDPDDRIRVSNAAARRLAGEQTVSGAAVVQALPALHTVLQKWRAGGGESSLPLPAAGSDREVTVRMTRLGWGAEAQVLVLLEDAGQLRAQAQQIKLAALGRLSAGIAHEVRNPLSAITQASQLLAEAGDTSAENRRLLEMIQRHAARIERIVRDVLELSRRDPSRREDLQLHDWLEEAAALYQESWPHAGRSIEIADVPQDLHVLFDPAHLQQVLFNLWDNSFAHGARDGRRVTVRLLAARSPDGDAVHLDVADDGAGIPESFHERIFEPFFSAGAAGTGLGLFLCRELCEYNQARLSHLADRHGATFRIRFSMPPSVIRQTAPAATAR
ncbi:MAG: two-component system sensor histidine kinase NtrB [Gammaproteobacteria bacterium]